MRWSVASSMWLYDSTNGGRSWTYRSTLPALRGWEADLVRPSANVGFALVKGFGTERAADAGIAETTDGGATWSSRSDPCERNRAARSFGFTQRLQANLEARRGQRYLIASPRAIKSRYLAMRRARVRGVKRWRQWCSSEGRFCPSIQP